MIFGRSRFCRDGPKESYEERGHINRRGGQALFVVSFTLAEHLPRN